ncbi:hypothetical protein [Kordia jejudonensis]|uniref:hypothetical protein n=1 Tax=Kordia jejudonensis TaxID=1348245 RepID=UPI0012E0B890|nr:hypothetical protein [Kordia jejudonensis]
MGLLNMLFITVILKIIPVFVTSDISTDFYTAYSETQHTEKSYIEFIHEDTNCLFKNYTLWDLN